MRELPGFLMPEVLGLSVKAFRIGLQKLGQFQEVTSAKKNGKQRWLGERLNQLVLITHAGQAAAGFFLRIPATLLCLNTLQQR